MSAHENGGVPDADLVGNAADLLAERLAQIDERLAELEPLRDEQKRLAGALRAIAPEHPRAAPAPAPAPARSSRHKPAAGWSVGQGKRDDALEALRVIGEPARVQAVAERAGMATETARKALEALRADELVRVARSESAPGGTRKLYALMPEGDR